MKVRSQKFFYSLGLSLSVLLTQPSWSSSGLEDLGIDKRRKDSRSETCDVACQVDIGSGKFDTTKQFESNKREAQEASKAPPSKRVCPPQSSVPKDVTDCQEKDTITADVDINEKNFEYFVQEVRLQRLARIKAEEAYKAQASFLDYTVHELRNSVGAMIPILDLIEDVGVIEENVENLKIAKNCGASSLRFINDLLDFSKMGANKMQLEERDFSPTEVAESVLKLYTPEVDKKGLMMTLTVAPAVPKLLTGDSLRLSQILTNLVGNAIKFTKEGSVKIKLDGEYVEVSENRRFKLIGIVDDTGIGINPIVRPNMFQPFSQADGSTARHFGGSGLGLSIVKSLCEMMEGSIELGAKYPGSSFKFEVLLGIPSSSQ